MHGQEILIDQVLIHEQLGISNERVDVTNATYDKAKTALKKNANPYAFVENELQRNVVCMKEEFHARFTTILEIIYQ